MNILIVNNSRIPVFEYGGTERVIWYLGKALAKKGHAIWYLVQKGSVCDFANLIFLDETKDINEQIPECIDIVHFNEEPRVPVNKPFIVTMHGNRNDNKELHINTVFVSADHAARFGSSSFVYNGLDWDDYGKPSLKRSGDYFHFLGNASWRLKNVKGAISVIQHTRREKLKVMGGHRLNFRMGFRLTLSARVSFCGNVGGEKKISLLNASRGLIFPVKWHEPFGLAIIESLYFGCPVFGTPYGSLPELVPTELGFLSAEASELAKRAEQYQNFSASRCHQWCIDCFSSAKMAEAYLLKYEKVLNGESLNSSCPRLLQIQQEKFLPWK